MTGSASHFPLLAAWSRRRPRKLAVIGGVVAVVIAAGLAGAVTQPSNVLKSNEAASVLVRTEPARGDPSVGTGIVLTASGVVKTTDSVVENANSISVRVPGRSKAFTASIVGLDPADDVAVIQLFGAGGLATARVGDLSHVAVGDDVTALVAHEKGDIEAQGTVVALDSSGIDKAAGTQNQTVRAMELSASVQNLGSGAPVIDGAGRVIGLMTDGSRRMAIGIERALTLAHDMTSGTPNPNVLQGRVAVLGVGVEDSIEPGGARVVAVAGASPAQAAGIREGDVLVALGSTRVSRAIDVPDALRTHHQGDRLRVRWITSAGHAAEATVVIAGGTAR